MNEQKKKLSLELLKTEAVLFCDTESVKNHVSLIGVTDGKAVGTYVEHHFKEYLQSKYIFTNGNSANGIDLPDDSIRTDIKVTSFTQPQSSCPFKSAEQKIFGLGYNLLVFVYEKIDTKTSCLLDFKNCTFIDSSRTVDYTLTKRLREMIEDDATEEDIIGFLQDRNIPGDDIVLQNLAQKILSNTPEQGYLTISNALQWRLQYSRAIYLKNRVEGILNYDR